MIHPAYDRASKAPASADDDPCKYFAHDVESHPFAGRGHPTRGTRMVSYRFPESSILIYTDGSCLNQNSRTDVQSRRAGCAVVFGTHPPSGQMKSHCSSWNFRLENQGPDGNYHAATSNRAELRAATAALEAQLWGTEGWRFVTIATDSTCVVKGITEWVPNWRARQWTKATGEDVANKYLWMLLLSLVNKQARKGCEVRFWHINRENNTKADMWAKAGATKPEVDRYWGWDLVQLEAAYRPRVME
jgi:ribonuclease HI